MSRNEFYELKSRKLNISERYFDEIKNSLVGLNVNLEDDKQEIYAYCVQPIINLNIFILEDEWILCELSSSAARKTHGETEFFKCDTIDGLTEILNDIKLLYQSSEL